MQRLCSRAFEVSMQAASLKLLYNTRATRSCSNKLYSVWQMYPTTEVYWKKCIY